MASSSRSEVGCSGSSSEDEFRHAETSSNGESKRRRRRGRRTRKMSERGSTPASDYRPVDTPPLVESRKRTCSVGAPPAPRNTNDFLLEDMEKREEDGAKRVRREEMEKEIEKRMSSRSDEEIAGEDEFEDQYEESWQECVVDKYKEMNHDELARRCAAMEKNRDEVERKFRWEKSKAEYLEEKLMEAESKIRSNSPDQPRSPDYCPTSPLGDLEDPAPSGPTPSAPPPSACYQMASLTAPNCSPNVISSPRA